MAKVFHIPNGPENLKSLFPEIDFNDVSEYYIEVLDETDTVVATTTLNKIGCCCGSDSVRVHFLNHFGTFDAVNFEEDGKTYKPESDLYKKGLPATFSKNSTGNERRMLSGKNSIIGSTECYGEQEMPWIKQLIGSPKAVIEQKIAGAQNEYLPVVIKDAEFDEKRKDAFRYPVTVELTLSNDEIPIRN
ncbi:MAG TPA: hypothetical protein PLS87_11390 [Ferruginibacter sp.]|nr:hypothetical protein [Ferruginibacter sp.]HRO97612.1 hypothetical protein [Ferruginibacter sp.]